MPAHHHPPKSSPCGRSHGVLILENELLLGGLEKKLYDLVARIDRSHYRVIVCCLKQGGYFKESFVGLGTPFYEGLLRNRYDALAYRRLGEILARHDIELIYTIAHPNTMVFSHLARLSGRVRRTVVSIHSTGSDGGRPLFRWYQRPFLGRVDRFIAVANEHKRYLVESEGLADAKIVVIHNGVDLETYRPAPADDSLRNALGIGPEEIVVTTVASLKPLKRIDLLLRSASGILSEDPRVRLLIVGDGPERSSLEGLAAALGIEGRVTFAGVRDDVDGLLRLSSIFVLPSRTEAFPNAVLEAMASGLPVVATDVGSVGEVVEDGASGLLVPRDDVDALQGAVRSLLADEGRMRAFGMRGRRIVEKDFRLDTMCRKREALFGELLCGSTNGPERG